ncbi:MAG TPA: ATP-binding protein [Candidatus Babeliaceae bacterium]|nr:ATP-binding protein [Candidatus Babeliaceae bacterium]
MIRFNLSELETGVKKAPLKLLIYGDNGVGKSTFASEAESCVFMDIEGNIDHLNAVPKQSLDTWEECLEFMRSLIGQQHSFKTLIIDSLEALEQKIWKHICIIHKAKGIDDPQVFKFGKGYALALDIWRSFLENLNHIRRRRGMSIIFIGHAGIRKHENLEGTTFDRYELRINAKAAGLISDWVNCILFANTEVKIEENKYERNPKAKKKVRLGNRIINTTCNASYLAKNIYNLPEKLPLDWDIFHSKVEEFYKSHGVEDVPGHKESEGKADQVLKLFEVKGFSEDTIEEILGEFETTKENLKDLENEELEEIIDRIKGE